MASITMTDIISTVNNLKPNAYSDQDKTLWLNEVESMIFDELIKNSEDGKSATFKPLDYVENPGRELYAGDRFSQIYVYYLFLKIDFMNGDTAQYNNDLALFNAEYQNYSAWYIRNHRQKTTKGIYY